jgi:ABC-type nitrate/sulfonate/bicarbonate transport system permease component
MTRVRLFPLLGLIALFGLWEAAAHLDGARFLLAGPSQIAAWLVGNGGLIGRALGVTLYAATLGFVWGNLAAIALAVLLERLPRATPLVSMLALLIFCLPLVATGPILRVLYGPGPGPQITLAALAVYYTTFLSLRVGLRAVPASWIDLVASYGRGPLTTLIHVRAMAALPYLFAALKIAAPAAFLGAMIGEFTGAERGMGVLAIRAMRGLDLPATWALATVAAATAMLTYAAFDILARLARVDAPALLLAPPAGRHRRPIWQRLGVALGVGLLMLLIWQGLMEGFDLSPFFAKRPSDVWAFLLTAPDASANRATLLAALGQTLVFTLPGLLAGLALGAALACVLMLVPGMSASILPVAVALRSVPIVTTAPLIVLALGRGAAGTITIVAVMIFFPTLVACLQGLHQAPGQIVAWMRCYAATPPSVLIHARLPAMLPAFFASARMAVPAAVLAVTTAEWLATGRGIGALMALTASTSNYNMLWSATALLGLTATLGYGGVALIETAVLRRFAPEQVVRG